MLRVNFAADIRSPTRRDALAPRVRRTRRKTSDPAEGGEADSTKFVPVCSR